MFLVSEQFLRLMELMFRESTYYWSKRSLYWLP